MEDCNNPRHSMMLANYKKEKDKLLKQGKKPHKANYEAIYQTATMYNCSDEFVYRLIKFNR
jgi:hypothetical protein